MRKLARRKERLINFRLPFLSALSFAAGIAVTYFCRFLTGGYGFMVVPFFLSALALAAVFVFKRRAAVYAVIVFAVFGSAFFICSLALERYAYSEVAESISCLISGKVRTVSPSSGSGFDVVLYDVRVNGEKVFGGMRVKNIAATCAPPQCGYSVSFIGAVTKYDLISYGGLNYNALDGIKYSAAVRGGFGTEYGFSLFGVIRSSLSDLLCNNLNGETASVAFAMLTGDSSAVSEATLASFRFGGIAHIFAVSGLHIGVLYGVLGKLFKTLKLNRFAAAALNIAVIVFYGGVCGFTPSSVRAIVACATTSAAGLFFRKYDALNALSIAAILLLAINPLNLFDAGFVLSVSAVLGIAFLNRRIVSWLRVLPDKISRTVGVTLSAQAGTLPALYLNFGYISGAGFLLNLIILPLLSALYILIFFSSVICFIVPPLAQFVLPVVCLPLEAVINFAVRLGFENALIRLSCGWYFLPAYCLFLLCVSDKLNLKLAVRSLVACACVCAIVLSCIFSGRVFAGSAKVFVTAYYGGGAVFIKTDEGTVLIVTEDFSSARLEKDMNAFCVDGADAVIIIGGDGCAEKFYSLGVDTERLYLAGSLIDLENIYGTETVYSDNFYAFGAEYKFAGSDAVFVTVNGVSLGIFADEPPKTACADMIIANGGAGGYEAKEVVYFNGGRGGLNIYECGGLQFYAEGGRINLKGLVPSR